MRPDADGFLSLPWELGVPIVFSDVSLSRCVRTALYYAGGVEETRMMLCLLGRRRRRRDDDDDDDHYSCDPPSLYRASTKSCRTNEWFCCPCTQHTALSLYTHYYCSFQMGYDMLL